MNLFKNEAPVIETTGSAVLRAATRSRMLKGHLGPLSRDLQIPISDLISASASSPPLSYSSLNR